MLYSICDCIYRELVRMRAACCILRFIRLTPSYQRHLQENCRKLLYDKDPGVMSIGVKIQLQLLKVRPISCFPFLSFKNVRNKSWRELIYYSLNYLFLLIMQQWKHRLMLFFINFIQHTKLTINLTVNCSETCFS